MTNLTNLILCIFADSVTTVVFLDRDDTRLSINCQCFSGHSLRSLHRLGFYHVPPGFSPRSTDTSFLTPTLSTYDLPPGSEPLSIRLCERHPSFFSTPPLTTPSAESSNASSILPKSSAGLAYIERELWIGMAGEVFGRGSMHERGVLSDNCYYHTVCSSLLWSYVICKEKNSVCARNENAKETVVLEVLFLGSFL